MQHNLREFITEIPKSDLHVHLDGSVRIGTLIELSKQHKLPLPSYTVAGLNELVFKNQYKDLVDYLQGFGLVLPVMQTPENLERISYEFAQDNIKEGVCYVEVRFAPHFHINNHQTIDQVLLSIDRGLQKAKLEYNQRPEVKAKQVPTFNYGIIACAMRSFGKGFSPYLDLFFAAHQHASPEEIVTLSSYELAKACIRIRDQYGIPMVALDLAGAEAGNPPIYHQKAYHFAHQNLMNLTVHAGEAAGPESIFQAVTELYPERIGHGFHLFSKEKLTGLTTKGKNSYLKNLVQYVAKNRITFEVCLTSNLQTIPSLKTIKKHPLAKMLDSHLSVAICTDNRTVSKTTLTNELMLAVQNFNLTRADLKNIMVNSFKKSFYFGSYNEKIAYIKQIAARYDYLAEKSYL